MRKLRLDLDELAVESFETQRSAGHAGTVKGREIDAADDGDIIGTIIILTQTCPIVTWCASCVATCDSCDGPSCNSCQITTCYTGNSPECCAIVAVA
ncbi:MAG TPA: pinensin family lanthipeptide [Longimicrobiaceae bacterium]